MEWSRRNFTPTSAAARRFSLPRRSAAKAGLRVVFMTGFLLPNELVCLTSKANLHFSHLADARRLHRGRDAVDDGEALTATPSRGGAGGIFAGVVVYETVPVVRDPDVAGGINGHVGDHLDAAALEKVDGIASPVGEKVRMRASGINSASDFSFETACKEL